MHLEFIVYATPKEHEDFVRRVGNWKYPVEGKLRKGNIKPVISEIKTYDVRINKEVAPRFLRDLDARSLESLVYHNKSIKIKFIRMFIKLFRKFSPFKKMESASLPKENKFHDGWRYTFFVGAIEDSKTKSASGEDREWI